MTAGTALGVSIQAAAPNITSQLFGSGLIGLREGLEAAIVVTILVAFLVKADRRDALKWVWLGVAAAILMTVAVFLGIQFGENTISGLAAEAIAGIASLVAVAIVTTMVLWMKRAAASMSGELRSDASSTSVGLHVAVSGTGAQAAAEVSLIDHWTIGVPVGTASGTVFTLPASFRLEGDIASGSTFGAAFGRFLDYSMSLSQLGSLSGILQRTGQVAATGHFDQTFSGPVSFTYFGPGVATIADFEMQLFVFDLTQGDIDFFHTLSASLALPPGFTAASSSGTPLFVSSAVPEPETLSLMVLGLIAVARARFRPRRARR